MDKNLIDEIKVRLETNRYELKQLDKHYIRAFAPGGYKGGTSYEDADIIHGSRKEYRIEEFAIKRERLIKLIELDEEILFRAMNEIDITKYLELLRTTKEKVYYLKNIVGLNKREISDKLNLSYRHIQRIYKGV